MSELATEPVSWQGISFALVDQGTKAKWEEVWRLREEQALAKRKPSLSREEYADQLAVLIKREADGAFDWDGEESQRRLGTVAGVVALLCLLGKKDAATMKQLAQQDPEGLLFTFKRVMMASFPDKAEQIEKALA